MKQIFDSEAYSPSQIAVKVGSLGVTKAQLPLLPMATLGNIVGGSALVALVYHFIYRHG